MMQYSSSPLFKQSSQSVVQYCSLIFTINGAMWLFFIMHAILTIEGVVLFVNLIFKIKIGIWFLYRTLVYSQSSR